MGIKDFVDGIVIAGTGKFDHVFITMPADFPGYKLGRCVDALIGAIEREKAAGKTGPTIFFLPPGMEVHIARRLPDDEVTLNCEMPKFAGPVHSQRDIA